jgi:hypothetical protein
LTSIGGPLPNSSQQPTRVRKMSFIKSLTFSTANDLIPTPLEKKRRQLVTALKEQLALFENPNLTKSRKKWIDIDGERILMLKDIPVRPWWKETLEGKVMKHLKLVIQLFQQLISAMLSLALRAFLLLSDDFQIF